MAEDYVFLLRSMAKTSSIPISVSRSFEAPAEIIYSAWLEPEIAEKFFFATADGKMVRAEIDPRVGGEFVMTDRRKSGDVEHGGRFLELNPPHKIAFEFGVPADNPERTIVAIEINPKGSGCEVSLNHEMSPEWADYAEKTRMGWSTMLDRLAEATGE